MEAGQLFWSAFAGFWAGLFAFVVANRQVYSRDVIGERQKWREFIRAHAVKCVYLIRHGNDHELDVARHELALRFHPNDPDDEAILCLLKDKDDKEFIKHISILLKYDWEKTKIEASWWRPFFTKSIRPSHPRRCCKSRYTWKLQRANAIWAIILIFSLILIMLSKLIYDISFFAFASEVFLAIDNFISPR